MADPATGEFTKEAGTVEEADRLRHEARVLAAARHPGVVELRSFDGRSLRQTLVAGPPLSELEPPPFDLGRIAVAVATTVADLHEIGVTHGALVAAHILVPPAGGPVLCSFGRGDASDGEPIAREARAFDVVTLARTLLATGALPGPLVAVMEPVASGGRTAPSARRLAIRLENALATTETTRPDHDLGPRRLRQSGVDLTAAVALRSAFGIIVVGVALLLVAVAVGTFHPSGGAGTRGRSASSQSARTRGSVAPGRSSKWACPAVDLGCLPVHLVAGVLARAGHTYRIGEPGDVVVVGRWGCANALPAVLRAETGEVWAWRDWAVVDRPATARLVAHVGGAYSLRVGRGPRGCDFLQVLRRGGQTVVVDPQKPA